MMPYYGSRSVLPFRYNLRGNAAVAVIKSINNYQYDKRTMPFLNDNMTIFRGNRSFKGWHHLCNLRFRYHDQAAGRGSMASRKFGKNLTVLAREYEKLIKLRKKKQKISSSAFDRDE
jgi:hypothetical protein